MVKAYSEDLRIKVINYINQGFSQISACEIFQIGRNTIYRWKIQQKTTNNIGQNANDPKKELSTEKTRSSEDIYQEILEMVEILGDEKQLLKNFENLKGLELENLKKEMKIYFKEFPEFEEFLTKNLKDSDSLIDLLNKIEKKFPEFKAVFKNSLIQSKMKKLSHENEENEKKRRNSMNN